MDKEEIQEAQGGEVSSAEAPPSPEEELARLRTDLAEKEAELSRLQDRFLRLAAEFENYKKRVAREREEFAKFAGEALILEFLPILDNLERALAAARVHENSEGLIEGVEMIQRLFLSTLEKVGVKPIEALGKEFDPNFHQAVLQVESHDGRDNIVVEEVQRGYLLENRVLRPAMVKVSKSTVSRSPFDVPSSEPSEPGTSNVEPRT